MPSASDSKNIASLNGVGLNKKFMQEDGELFPLDIFKDCTKLVRAEYIFSDLNSDISTSADNLELPGDMFKNNTKLTHIDGCFYNMTSNIKYRLTGKGFINCNLQSVRYCFDEGGFNKGNKVGGIPYGLFYQERKSTQTYQGWSAADATALGIDETKEYPTGTTLPQVMKYSQELKLRHTTITDMTCALNRFAGTQATGYEREIFALTSLETAGDVITQNESYDPRKYIVNPSYNGNPTIIDPTTNQPVANPNYNPHYVILNPNYNPYLYEWNVWYPDGTVNVGDEIEKSTLYSKVKDGSINQISKIIPTELYDTNTVSGPMTGTRETSRNYVCPPDLFRYCANQSNTSVSQVLGSSSTATSGSSNRLTNGINGRIPEILFRPLSNVTALTYVFANCYNITPHKWDTDDSLGEMFPADLFAYNTKLTNLSGIFQGLYIPQNVQITETLFRNNTMLSNISYMFYDAVFYYTGALSGQTFTNNRQLNNISYMFAASSRNSHGTNANIKSIVSNLFTASNNPNLNNFSGFLQFQGNTSGTVPAFWEWSKPSQVNKVNVFEGVSKSKITNSSTIITNGWGDGMID